MCYCGLFVNDEIKNNPYQMGPIPERRPREVLDAALAAAGTKQISSEEKSIRTISAKRAQTIKVWRCTVCGYLCAREIPPPICPICKAKAERFEQFTLG
jgi:rubrerythrin